MGLLKRMFNIGKAKANKAVEKAEREDPIAIAKVELNEAKTDLRTLESAVKTAKGQINITQNKVDSAKASASDWLEKAKTAKNAGNMELAQAGAEKSVEFTEEAERLEKSLESATARYDSAHARFKTKTKEIDALEKAIKEGEINFKTAKALNDLETSETSGNGEKSVDRINDMLNIVEEETAYSEANLEVGQSEEAKLDEQFDALGKSKKADDLLANL
jgi:phage shock protein A